MHGPATADPYLRARNVRDVKLRYRDGYVSRFRELFELAKRGRLTASFVEERYRDSPEETGVQLCFVAMRIDEVGLRLAAFIRAFLKTRLFAPPAEFVMICTLSSQSAPPETRPFFREWIQELKATCYAVHYPQARAAFEQEENKARVVDNAFALYATSTNPSNI